MSALLAILSQPVVDFLEKAKHSEIGTSCVLFAWLLQQLRSAVVNGLVW